MIEEKSRHQSRTQRQQSVSNEQQKQQPPRLLASGFVHLTGGKDTGGRPVICFPPRQIIRMHLNNVSSPELASLVDYLVSIAPSETGLSRQHGKGLAFLADFRACSQSIFRIVIDALDIAQSHSKGAVSVFYVLMPRSKELAKSLQKMLGLYQKKTLLPTRKSGPDPNAKSFQSVLLPTSQELYQFVSKPNLIPDFGGSLNYDHPAWMRLRSTFDTLLAKVTSIADNAPAALDRLAQLQDNPIQDGGGDNGEAWLQDSAHGMQDQFQQATASLGLEAASEHVADLLAECKEPENHPETRALTGNALLKLYIERLERLKTRLDELRQLLQNRWKQSEAELLVDGRLTDYRRAVVELGDWLDRWGKEAVKRVDTRAIANQQMAEDAKEKMRIQVLEPSTAKLIECRNLTSKLRRLVAALPPDRAGREPHEAAELADKLEAKLKSFNEKIKSASELLARICAFFGGCAGLLKWYRRCMRKLPLDLLQPQHHSRLQSSDLLPIVSKWPPVAKSFLQQHPCPTKAQLDDIADSMALIDNSVIRNEAQLLMYRTNLLRKLLSPEQTKINEVITVGEYRELLDSRDRQAEPDGDPAFAALEPSQSLAGSSDDPEETSPVVPTKSTTFQFPPERDAASERELRRFRRRTERSMASSSRSGTEIVEVIPQPIVINHRLMMSRPPARGFELFDEERPQARKEADDAISRQAVTTLESLPKEETVRRYLENMVTPPPPLTATTDDSLGSGSRTGRSLSNLVSELRELKDALFYGGSRGPVARRGGRRSGQPNRQPQRQRLPAAVSVDLLRSRSEQNLASQATIGGDAPGRRQHKLLLLQLDEPPSTRGVAYPVEVVDINKIIGDIRDIASDRYQLEPQPPKLNHHSSRSRLIGGEAGAGGYSMSRMSDIDPAVGNYSLEDLVDEDEYTRNLRPSRHSDNFLLLTSPDGRQAGGRSHSPRSLLSPPPPPSIPEEAADATEAARAAERSRWRRRDNRVWLHNSYNNHM